jgi:hypothetical protein
MIPFQAKKIDVASAAEEAKKKKKLWGREDGPQI